jgi:hypothetical protein
LANGSCCVAGVQVCPQISTLDILVRYDFYI